MFLVVADLKSESSAAVNTHPRMLAEVAMALMVAIGKPLVPTESVIVCHECGARTVREPSRGSQLEDFSCEACGASVK